jgi:hypothetical protein
LIEQFRFLRTGNTNVSRPWMAVTYKCSSMVGQVILTSPDLGWMF